MSPLLYKFLQLRVRIRALTQSINLEQLPDIVIPDDLIGITLIINGAIERLYANVILFKSEGLELLFKYNDKHKHHCLLYWEDYGVEWFVLNDISLIDED